MREINWAEAKIQIKRVRRVGNPKRYSSPGLANQTPCGFIAPNLKKIPSIESY